MFVYLFIYSRKEYFCGGYGSCYLEAYGGHEPSYYVVLSKYVAYRVKQDYEEWFNALGKNGQQRNETTMRTFEIVDEEEQKQYKDAWHLFGM